MLSAMHEKERHCVEETLAVDTLQQRLAHGDPLAFAELYDACADRVGHYLLVRLGSREDADDTLQETFLRIARTRQELENIENLAAYVFAIARNEAARTKDSRTRRQCGQVPLSGDDLFICASDEAETDVNRAAEIIAAALGQLDDDLREVVELKTYGRLTYQQISQVTGLPQGTVATRYRSALVKMQRWFERQAQ